MTKVWLEPPMMFQRVRYPLLTDESPLPRGCTKLLWAIPLQNISNYDGNWLNSSICCISRFTTCRLRPFFKKVASLTTGSYVNNQTGHHDVQNSRVRQRETCCQLTQMNTQLSGLTINFRLLLLRTHNIKLFGLSYGLPCCWSSGLLSF